MEIPEELLYLSSAEIETNDETYRIEIPAREVTDGDLHPGEIYRVALLASGLTSSSQKTSKEDPERRDRVPPIAEGDRRTVDIEDLGKQGDGIARVERGYVIIVPETEIGDRVAVEIKNVQETLAFGEVIEHVEPAVHSESGACLGILASRRTSSNLEAVSRAIRDRLTVREPQ